MRVIKKDGRVQEFHSSKIRASILGASIDSNTIINEADLKILSNTVYKILKEIRGENGVSSSYEIFAIIIDTLNNDGFNDIAVSYLGYKNK